MITVHHFSDILCIWAYVAQIRLQELQQQFAAKVTIDYRFFPVFGDVAGKLRTQWQERGGIKGYQHHVQSVAADFPHLHLHPDVWHIATPSSSLPAHLYLAAAGLVGHPLEPLLNAMRQAFFVDGRDIANQGTLDGIISEQGLSLTAVRNEIHSGNAFARLAEDMQMARQLNIQASPTMVFNEDRQRLAGNVGYKIIEANIRELLERPQDCHSWC